MRSTLKVSFVLLAASSSLVHANPLFGFGGNKDATPAAPLSKWSADAVFAPGSTKPAPAELVPCVDQVASKLGIDPNMQTDPAIIKDILSNVMHIDNLDAAKKLFEGDTDKPVPLDNLIKLMRKGLTEHHPALGVTACAVLEDPKAKIVLENVNKDVIKRVMNHIYLLNKLVTKCSSDKEFMRTTKAHLDKEVNKLVGSESYLTRIWRLWQAAGFFGVVKDYSIEQGIEGMQEVRDAGADEQRVKNWARGLTINIIEATATDLSSGYMDNVRVGKAISGEKVQSIEVSKGTQVVRYGLSMNFARLYETWNLAFMTGNLQHLDILFPKLLIPRVLLASGAAYIYERVIALWLSIQFFLMADLQKVPRTKFTGQSELATMWGKINLRYYKWIQAQDIAAGMPKPQKKEQAVPAKK